MSWLRAGRRGWHRVLGWLRPTGDPGLVFDDVGFHWQRHATPWSDVLTVKVQRRWRAFGRLAAPVLHVVVVCKRGPDRVLYPAEVVRGLQAEALRTEIEQHWLAWCQVEDAKWIGRPRR